MPFILDRSRPDSPRVVCDCCRAEIRVDIDIQEVVHVRLHVGLGFALGDGNNVEVDL